MVKKLVRKANRSGTKQCPVCEKEVPLVEHHLRGREIPRWNENWNIAWICATCHDLIHLGEVIIEGWFKLDGIRTLVWRKKGEEPKIGEGIIPPEY